MKKLRNTGFTIVELMIATTVFSTVLLGCAAAMITIGRQLHKADISIATQNASRSIIEEVSRQVQLSSDLPVNSTKVVCIGSIRYSYALNAQVENAADPPKNQALHGLWRDINPNPGVCKPATQIDPAGTAGSSGQELLPLHTRIVTFAVNPGTPPYVNTNNRLWDVEVAVVYGDNDVLINPGVNNNCRSSTAGGAFCAISQLHTSVFRRVAE